MTTNLPPFDLLVVGGGVGGVAAALTAARLGRRVALTERSDWLGGQLTTQAVPPDDHPWIDTELASPSYRALRDAIRAHYRRNYPLTPEAAADPTLNPGRGNVSTLCHEPRVAALAIEELLSPHIASGALTVLRRHTPLRVEREGRLIRSITFSDEYGGQHTLQATLIADATEEGDLLGLAGMDYRVGAEARSETGELHAPAIACPEDQQAITWCVALEYRADEDHTIERPGTYEYWRDTVDARWPGPQLSWRDVVPDTGEVRERPLFTQSPARAVSESADDLWHYRRILSRHNLLPGFPGGEITLVNWPQIDYWEKPLLDVTAEERNHALAAARELTRSFVYWMQTEAPRHDGGTGYPELKPRGDVTGTQDGLAKEPYIRESRRIRSLFTITEEHIGVEMRGANAGSALFDDTVGIGHYRIDLHPSTSGRGYVDIDCYPFQIPLGALIPQDVDNLVAAGKNIGTTHISNGAYRLHPVEWSIGEAVGALAEISQAARTRPAEIRSQPDHLRRLQALLREKLGVPLAWPDHIRTREEVKPTPSAEEDGEAGQPPSTDARS